MKSTRPQQPSASGKRRHRRTEEELIAALQHRIAELERRKQLRAVKKDPVLKLADKLVRALRKAESQFVSAGRVDLANSAKAGAISIQQLIAPKS